MTATATPQTSVLPSTLTRRDRCLIEMGRGLAGAAYPSEWINQLQASVTLVQHRWQESNALFKAAPALYQVVRRQVQQALGSDPDTVTWTSALQIDAPVSFTLTQIAVENLRLGFTASDLNKAVSLSAGDETTGKAFELTPEQVLNQLDSLKLQDQYNLAVRDYWEGIAPGQSLSCLAYAAQLRRELITNRALLARAMGELTEEGLNMWLQVIAAPTGQARLVAGAEAGDLLVSNIVWGDGDGDGDGDGVVFKGAFVIHGRDCEKNPRELLFVPGMDNELFEFASRARLQAQMVRWLDGAGHPGWLLWQLLPYHSRSVLYDSNVRRALATLTYQPVAEDIFEHSIGATVFCQHGNELISAVMVSPSLQTAEPNLLPVDASGVALSYAQTTEQWRDEVAGKHLPAEWVEVVADFVRKDALWHGDDVSFGSLDRGVALRNRQEKIMLHEHSILQLLAPGRIAEDTPSYSEFVKFYQAIEAQRSASLACLSGLGTEAGLANPALLTTDTGQGSPQNRLIASRSEALIIEGQLQVLQKLLPAADFTLLTQALKLNLAGADTGTDLRLVAIALGTEQQSFELVGSFAITSRQALLNPAIVQSALLFVPGQAGGLARFDSLAQLQNHVGKTLARRPDCSLWLTVALEQQAQARTWVAGLPAASAVALQLNELTVGIVEYSVKAQIKAHKKTLQTIKKNLLAIVDADHSTALRFLAQTSAILLQVPVQAARAQAYRHIVLLRQAQVLKEQLAPWLQQKSDAVGAEYARQSEEINRSVLALERYLSENLPAVSEFAAQKLREQFKHDGFEDELDPLVDIIEIPDQVLVIKTPPNPINLPPFIVPEIELGQFPEQFRSYSLVQLALQNMDPQDPAVALRLKYMRVLQPQWQGRLTLEYLGRILPALDVSGAYKQLIVRVFYGKPEGISSGDGSSSASVLNQLMTRPYRQALALELWAARQQDMDETALALFSHAINARTVADLRVAGMDIEMGFVAFGNGVGRYSGTFVEGVRVIRDKASDMTLLYLPGFAGGNHLQLYSSLQLANEALLAMAENPVHLRYLAQRTEPGELQSEVIKVLSEGVTDSFGVWLSAMFTDEVDMALSLSKTRPARLIMLLWLTTWSNAKRDVERSKRYEQQVINTVAMVFSFIPGLNLIADVYYIVQAVNALRHAESAYEVAQLVLQIGMCLVDIVLTVVTMGLEKPPASAWERVSPQDHELSLRALQPLAARETMVNEGWAALSIKPQPRPLTEPVFSGYEVDLSPQDACALSGRYDRGSYLKDGKQFIVQKGKSYRVARPKNAQALHLQHPQTGRLGPPLRQGESGEWLFAAGYGLPGGFNTAQSILMNSGMSLEVAQGLLADYDFPAGSGLDQLFAMSVQRDGMRPEWADRFRAVTAGPMAGPSHRTPATAPVVQGLEGYALTPATTSGMVTGSRTLDRVVIENTEVFVGQEINGDGFYPLYRPNPLNPAQLRICGRLSGEGVYHMSEPVMQDYIAIDGHFYLARFNQPLNRMTIIKLGGSDEGALVVEPAGSFQRMGQWRLVSSYVAQLGPIEKLENLARQLMPAAATPDQVSHVIACYGRQIIKSTVPELLLARTAGELERLASQYVLRHGMPVEVLTRVFEARVNGQPIPHGVPVYDELQGITALTPLTGNNFQVHESYVASNYLSILPLTAEETALQVDVLLSLGQSKNIRLSSLGVMNRLLRSILRRKGYMMQGLGHEPLFNRGFFSQIFTGPNGEVYVMTTKVLSMRPAGNRLSVVGLHTTRDGVHLSDAWLERIIGRLLVLFPDSLLLRTLRHAHEHGRLFKVLAGVKPDGEVLIFRLQLAMDH